MKRILELEDKPVVDDNGTGWYCSKKLPWLKIEEVDVGLLPPADETKEDAPDAGEWEKLCARLARAILDAKRYCRIADDLREENKRIRGTCEKLESSFLEADRKRKKWKRKAKARRGK